MEGIKIGDRVAAAVKHRNTSALRVGVVEKIHPPTGAINVTRYTIREDDGLCTVVSSTRTVAIQRDKYHTMEELYYYRALYNAHAARGWLNSGIPVVKSWKHDDGTMFDGSFIVTAHLSTGQVSNHYPKDLWDMFDVPEVEKAPPWDGHDPKVAAQRLRDAPLNASKGVAPDALALERRDQQDKTFNAGPVSITPPIDEDYWKYRVKVSEHPYQAVIAFPKFGTIGIGFAIEDDWNTNLPYTCDTEKIVSHIWHNRRLPYLPRETAEKAVRMIQEACEAE